MGSHITKPSNKSMVDRLVEHHSYIHSATVEGVFRAVDRAMYFDLEEGDAIDPYDDDPWRRGNLHLSAPCIYAKVVEALELRPGLSFLNLGSGTGYLNTIIGLLVGPNGLNHGIEYHSDVVEYANKRLQQFKRESHAIDKYHFSEPYFVRGNCINLNPNSKYDRIYLGAACLPELEEFMKKLIKPNGGILVMPYENHLIRYKRTSETVWVSEKLMDVNFTLMIRQDDKESMIDMPLAQAKSLKELCRISIRQQLRDRVDLVNPTLRHSDNINARRLRKAKAEREILAREEQRVGARDYKRHSRRSKSQGKRNVDCNHTCRASRVEDGNPPHDVKQTRPTSSSAGGRVVTRSASRRMEVGDNDHRERQESSNNVECNCPCRKSRLDITETNSKQSRQTNSSVNGRVVTRSASRRMEAAEGESHEGTSRLMRDSNNTRGENTGTTNAGASSFDSNGSDDDGNSNNPQNHHSTRQRNNCARTRPYVSSANNVPPSLSGLPYSLSSLPDRVLRPSALLPYQRRIARIIDSSSASSSSSSDGLDIRTVEEYDYIGRQVVLNWPGFIRHTLQNEDSDFSLQDSESSSDFSGSNLSDLLLDGNASEVSSDASWDSFFESLNNPATQSDRLSTSSSQFQTPTGLTDEEDDEEVVRDNNKEEDDDDDDEYITDDNLCNADVLARTSNQCSNLSQPQPGTSGTGSVALSDAASTSRAALNRDKKGRMTGPLIAEQHEPSPLSRKLRFKRRTSDEPSASGQPSTSTAPEQAGSLDRPVPGCSRADLNGTRDASTEDCDEKRYGCGHRFKHRKFRTVQNSNPASPASNQTTESTHSSMRISSADSLAGRHALGGRSQQSDQSGQGVFTGRVLLTAGLGTTLSIASRQYLPSSRRNGSFRLFERRPHLNSSTPGNRHHQCHPPQLSHKRKRHSSSESSEGSQPTSPHRRKNVRCIRSRCGCLHSSHATQGGRVSGGGGGSSSNRDNNRERRRARRRQRRAENECERYHNHLSCYIRQLALPGVLHSYLDYDRTL